FSRDWSSDVCSTDLIEIKTRPVLNDGNEQPDQVKLSVEVTHENVLASPDLKNLRMAVYVEAYEVGSDGAGGTLRDGGTRMVSNRSEERRVGREWTTR